MPARGFHPLARPACRLKPGSCARHWPPDPYLVAASALASSAKAGCGGMMIHYTRPSGGMTLVEEAKAIARAANDVGMRIGFALAVRDQNPLVYGDSETLLAKLPADAA